MTNSADPDQSGFFKAKQSISGFSRTRVKGKNLLPEQENPFLIYELTPLRRELNFFILELFHLKEYPFTLTLVLLIPDMPCFGKQCRFRSVDFFRSQLMDWHCSSFNVCICINNNLDQVTDWLIIGSGQFNFLQKPTDLDLYCLSFNIWICINQPGSSYLIGWQLEMGMTSLIFLRNQLIWICTVGHSIYEFVSTTRVKLSDWSTIGSGHGILNLFSKARSDWLIIGSRHGILN